MDKTKNIKANKKNLLKGWKENSHFKQSEGSPQGKSSKSEPKHGAPPFAGAGFEQNLEADEISVYF